MNKKFHLKISRPVFGVQPCARSAPGHITMKLCVTIPRPATSIDRSRVFASHHLTRVCKSACNLLFLKNYTHTRLVNVDSQIEIVWMVSFRFIQYFPHLILHGNIFIYCFLLTSMLENCDIWHRLDNFENAPRSFQWKLTKRRWKSSKHTNNCVTSSYIEVLYLYIFLYRSISPYISCSLHLTHWHQFTHAATSCMTLGMK